MNRTLEEEVKASLVNGYLPCAVAFKVARKLKATPKEVGDATNKLRLRIINCQLDCFQFDKATHDDLDSMQIDRTVAEAVEASLVDGYLPCAVAFQVARKLKVAPKGVADAANKLKIRIVSCQLDCFQFDKATHDDLDSMQIDRTVAEAVEASLVDGYLPCAVAFQVARKLKVAPKGVADAANKLKIRIVSCQLGCFP